MCPAPKNQNTYLSFFPGRKFIVYSSYLEYPFDTVVGLLYGCGLRLFECIGLRVQNYNSEDEILTVHGKGDKDRTIPLPRKLIPKLKPSWIC